MNRQTIAQKLRDLRGNRTREEVAKALNVSASAIAMYENALRVPRDNLKILIAEYYGVPVQDLFY